MVDKLVFEFRFLLMVAYQSKRAQSPLLFNPYLERKRDEFAKVICAKTNATVFGGI